MLDFEALENAVVFDSPYTYLTAGGVLTRAQAADIRREFPRITRNGFLPLSTLEAGGTFPALTGELRSPASRHGHQPYAGKRYVVQTTYLSSPEELERKERRGGLQVWLKRLNPLPG